MFSGKSSQRTTSYTFAVIVFATLVFSIFSSLRLWVYQQVRLSNIAPITTVSIQKEAWHGEQHEITLNKKRFDIHHIEHGINGITLFGEWDMEEDEMINEEKNKDEGSIGFSGLSPFLFFSELPHPCSYFRINHSPVLNGMNQCQWLENYLPPANPPPDSV